MARIVLITGAARGIGLAAGRRFLDEGWQVALLDIDGSAQRKAAMALGAPKQVLALEADVADEAAVGAAVARTLDRFGRIDALVNNAGVAEFGPIGDTGFDSWRRIMETNLDGMFLCSQAAVPALKDSGGAIVNIASISGLRASTLRVAYGTSKAAVMQLTRQQAVELGEFGIRANCVAPGPVRTKLAMAVHSQEIIDAYHDAIPLNRYGSEDEIASVVTFLVSDKAGYVTGQTIAVDGGFEAAGVGIPALRR